MRNLRWFIGLVFLNLCGTLFAESNCHCTHYDHRQNQLMPDLRVVVSPLIRDGAFSFLGEVGRRHWRANQTIGMAFTNEHQAKIGVEFLSQRLRYGFGSGTEEKWVNQWAVGGKYRYLVENCGVKSIDAFADYSHANDQKLKSVTCPSDSERLVKRRIAGAENFQIGLGTSLILSHAGTFNFGVNYEFIQYKRKYQSKKNTNGVGGYLGLEHRILDQFHLSLKGEFYEAYNYGEARLLWLKPVFTNGLTVGLFGNYTQGKNRLPSVAMFGIEVGYSFDVDLSCYGYRQGYRQCSPCRSVSSGCVQDGWLTEPAVYIPEVLAIAEQKVKQKPACLVPTSDPIPVQTVITFPTAIDVTPYFHGNELTYSFVPASSEEFTTSSNGIINVTAPVTVNITVTATNECGSTQQVIQIISPAD